MKGIFYDQWVNKGNNLPAGYKEPELDYVSGGRKTTQPNIVSRYKKSRELEEEIRNEFPQYKRIHDEQFK